MMLSVLKMHKNHYARQDVGKNVYCLGEIIL